MEMLPLPVGVGISIRAKKRWKARRSREISQPAPNVHAEL